jgi:predicted Mrr-cat superfamily restriction endonuclease
MNYKVKALTVSGLSKKIHRSGDNVTDDDFPEGRAKELVRSGFLVEVPEKNTDELIGKNQVQVKSKNEELEVELKTETNNILDDMAKKTEPKKGSAKK